MNRLQKVLNFLNTFNKVNYFLNFTVGTQKCCVIKRKRILYFSLWYFLVFSLFTYRHLKLHDYQLITKNLKTQLVKILSRAYYQPKQSTTIFCTVHTLRTIISHYITLAVCWTRFCVNRVSNPCRWGSLTINMCRANTTPLVTYQLSLWSQFLLFILNIIAWRLYQSLIFLYLFFYDSIRSIFEYWFSAYAWTSRNLWHHKIVRM